MQPDNRQPESHRMTDKVGMSDIILKAVLGTDAYTVTLPQSVTAGRWVTDVLTGRHGKYKTLTVFLLLVTDTLMILSQIFQMSLFKLAPLQFYQVRTSTQTSFSNPSN